ncbi:hypothetical protein [Pyrodictium abyssi]|uniref:hypothetical protein n=1 Tax=Pyrodictium abyssi TaxID=54256 RepID=UPI0030C77BE4
MASPSPPPGLLAAGLSAALKHGAAYATFTTSGAYGAEAVEELVRALGGPLSLPDGFATISVDGYKLVAGPRARPSRVEERLLQAWKRPRRLLSQAARRWGVGGVPEEPPRLLETLTRLLGEGFSMAVNVLLTDDLAPPLAPEGSSGGCCSPLIEELAASAVQVNLLAPKPLQGLLTVQRHPPKAAHGDPGAGVVAG